MAETPLPILAWHGMAWLTTSGTEPTRQHDSSTHVVCRSTRLHFFGSCTGYASRSESSSGCMCSGISLYARHSTGVSACWQPAADIGGCCLSPSTLCRLSDDAGAINPSINSVTARRLWLQRGRGTVCHHRPCRLFATDMSTGDQVSSFPSVIWLTDIWRCPCWLTVKLSMRGMQHYLC